ncbi:MAG TPA: FtsX-like permease family protein [Terriglobales bacterium]|nr:FtsX-like permease family protein [Terriglobales bacterium]
MTVHMDLRVLLFACGLGVATAALFGIVPALQSARVDLNDTLKDEARGSGASRERRRLRNALVIGEVAIAFCLLTGAALLLASLARLLQVDPGFNPQKLLAAHVALPGTRYASEAQVADFYRRATDQLKALPGVQQVAFSTDLPLRGWAFGVPFQVAGRMVENSRRPFAHLQSVTSDYFATLQIPMLRGRALNDLDNERARPVLVINQTLAEKFFPGEDPIGRHLVMDSGPGGPKSTAWEIVGVCGRVKVQDMAEAATRAPEVYLPFAQAAVSQSWVSVRTSGDPMLLRTAVEGVFQNLDPTLPLTAMGPMDVVLQRASGPARFRLRLFGALAVLGFLLSVVGIYSVRAYAVEQRQHEIGIRMALGATPRHVLQVFLREGAWVVAVGIALGAVMSLWLTRAMTSLLFSVQPSDPLVFTGSALLMAAAGVAASFLPARAAAKVDPASVITR